MEYEGKRYLLRRNPYRTSEIARNRQEKKEAIQKLLQQKNTYLALHPSAQVAVAQRIIREKIEHLQLNNWLQVKAPGRVLELKEDQEALSQEAQLDGCYVLQTDLPQEVDKQTIHDRYRDLSQVEEAFRTCKTALLKIRPWYVRKAESTRGHALVVMLAYLMVHHLQKVWSNLELTVEEGLKELSTLCYLEMVIQGGGSAIRIPTPNETCAKLLEAVCVSLPKTLHHRGVEVVSRKKLATRKKR